MPLTLSDLALLLAILSMILLLSSLLFTEKSMISRERLELTGKVAGIAFLVIAFYLIWKSVT